MELKLVQEPDKLTFKLVLIIPYGIEMYANNGTALKANCFNHTLWN